ncbi:hypothetical protein DCC62_23570 [candidate division KSB1 bacterium]|nr:MAG: hypothetical protein DCC62_23570 [candidate division KSB1 bacterium]
MTFEKYCGIVSRLLERHWGVIDKDVIYKSYSREIGRIAGCITLVDGSYIDFAEEIIFVNRKMTKGRYRYQYLKDVEIFRYDNYPKHPGISFPFHHKHTSTGVIQLEAAPKLIDIIEEALRQLF